MNADLERTAASAAEVIEAHADDPTIMQNPAGAAHIFGCAVRLAQWYRAFNSDMMAINDDTLRKMAHEVIASVPSNTTDPIRYAALVFADRWLKYFAAGLEVKS